MSKDNNNNNNSNFSSRDNNNKIIFLRILQKVLLAIYRMNHKIINPAMVLSSIVMISSRNGKKKKSLFNA
jgi:hypothetical protein